MQVCENMMVWKRRSLKPLILGRVWGCIPWILIIHVGKLCFRYLSRCQLKNSVLECSESCLFRLSSWPLCAVSITWDVSLLHVQHVSILDSYAFPGLVPGCLYLVRIHSRVEFFIRVGVYQPGLAKVGSSASLQGQFSESGLILIPESW